MHWHWALLQARHISSNTTGAVFNSNLARCFRVQLTKPIMVAPPDDERRTAGVQQRVLARNDSASAGSSAGDVCLTSKSPPARFGLAHCSATAPPQAAPASHSGCGYPPPPARHRRRQRRARTPCPAQHAHASALWLALWWMLASRPGINDVHHRHLAGDRVQQQSGSGCQRDRAPSFRRRSCS